MLLFTPHINSRVRYMAAWMGNYLFGAPLEITNTVPALKDCAFFFNYSDQQLPGNGYQVFPSGLLFENDIKPQSLHVSEASGLPCFFANNGQHPFDIFSAVFYLVSRYEEYLPHEKDAYGRYGHINSVAFKTGFLKRPLVDEWIQDLKQRLRHLYPTLSFAKRSFSFIPTYDVDLAWSYLNKGWLRNAGGFVNDLLKGNWKQVRERLLTLTNHQQDPFDVFSDLDELHRTYHLEPLYFLLLAEKYKGYDKNISPANAGFRQLIKQLPSRYDAGIHLSWQAWEQHALMKTEKQCLENITGKPVDANRMHYIKFDLPHTFEQLIKLGIKADYSMGYGSINGFRASTCTPYFWYNLTTETATSLTIFPYAYMEANSIFEQKDAPETALAELQYYHDTIKKLDGTFLTIFHNHLIGRSAEGRKWWDVYELFLETNFLG